MSISFSCPGCGHQFQVDDHLAGRRARCKHCGREIAVPSSTALSASPHVEPSQSQPAAASVETPARSGWNGAALVGVGMGVAVALMGGGALAAWLLMGGGDDGDRAASAPPPVPPFIPSAPGMVPPPFAVPSPPPPPVLSSDLSGVVEVTDIGDSYPDLPPAPAELTSSPGETIRESLVNRYYEAFNELMDEWDKIPPILDAAQDAREAEAALDGSGPHLKRAAERSGELERLDPLNKTELAEFSRRITARCRAVKDRLDRARDRIEDIPNLPRESSRKLIALFVAGGALDQYMKMGKPDPMRDHFVEFFVSEVPDVPTSRWIAERLKTLAGEPARGGVQAIFNPRARKASYRLWRVADQAALVEKIDFGQARDSIRFVYIVAAPIDPTRPKLKPAPAAPVIPPPSPAPAPALADAETVRRLIQVVETSDNARDRREAIDQLREAKATQAAAAIAGRLADDHPAALMALREFGPAAEPAVIARLSARDAQVRRRARQALRSLGGEAALEALENLPPEPDDRDQRDVAATIRAVEFRIKAKAIIGRDRTP